MREIEGNFRGKKEAIRKRDIDARFGYVRNHDRRLGKYEPDFLARI